MGQVKVLILTGSYGGGHEQAALALEKAFNLTLKRYQTEVLDVTSLVPAHLDSLEKHTFLSGVSHFPSLYHFLYKKTQKNNAAASLLKTLTQIGITRLIPVIEESQPDLIISTFPPSSAMMARIRQAGWFPSIPFLTVMTDYSVHSTWVNECTDGYLVASEDVRRRLIEMNVNPERIKVTGIPIQPAFSVKKERSFLRYQFNIPEKQKVLLIMGGGCGIFNHYMSFMKQTEKINDENLRIVIVCGHNQKAFRDFSEFAAASRHTVQVLGFVHNMSDWMALADLLVTKPGGLTVSEAIASELPMIIYRPLGGQETDNTQYLLASGVSVAAYNASELIDCLSNLLSHPSALGIMRNNLKAISIGRQDSAEKAVRAAETFLPVGTLNALEFA